MQKKKTVLEKEMNRREFLRYVGSLLLAVIGVTNLVRALSRHSSNYETQGYGSSTYGGRK